MILTCLKCRTRMKPKLRSALKAGTVIRVTCRCGEPLRFTLTEADSILLSFDSIVDRFTNLAAKVAPEPPK